MPGVSLSDGDLSELIRNPPCSIFVLMSRIVKRMNQRQRPEFSARPAVDRVPKAVLLVDPFGPFCGGRALPRWLFRARANRHELPREQGHSKALAFARGQKQSRLITELIARVSNRAAATFNDEQLGYAVLPTSAGLTPARTGCLLLDSVEVPALRFKDVDVQVRNIDVTCAQALGR